MNRLLLITGLLLIAVIGAEQYLNHHTETERVLKGQLRQLPGNAGMTEDKVRELRIESADTAWTYRLKNGNWHYPADENAFALNDRIKSFIKDAVESYGTIVDTQVRPKFGFDSKALLVNLSDSAGVWKQTLSIGASLPGTDTREAYMKISDSDTVFQVHADPRRGLHWERLPNRPPFLDPKVLPAAMPRRAIKKIVFAGHSIQELVRIEVEPEEEKQSPTDGPTYEWYSVGAGKRQQVPNPSIYAYISFLSRMKYTKLHDPAKMPKTEKYLILVDAQDTRDTLEVATQNTEMSYVLHRTTGHLHTLTASKAVLLFPSPAVLDTLQDPSPYKIAEPTGPFSLTSP